MRYSPSLVIVIPVFNEAESLPELVESIKTSLVAAQQIRLKVICVDDGSSDTSWQTIDKLSQANTWLHGLRLRKNFGKTYALQVGLENARQFSQATIVTMDADLQDDPAEIPKLLNKIQEGYDVVTGWKIKRLDPISKTFPSKVYNALIRWLFKLPIHDVNCGLKAYSYSLANQLALRGEQHRLIPILAHIQGYKVAELPVTHHPRKYGKTKYGWTRFLVGFLDALSLYLQSKFIQKPIHFFGSVGLISFLMGMAGVVYLSLLWLVGSRPIGDRPLLLFSILLIIAGIQILSFGLLAEMIQTQQTTRNLEHLVVERTPHA